MAKKFALISTVGLLVGLLAGPALAQNDDTGAGDTGADEPVNCVGHIATKVGTAGDDVLIGTPGPDVIVGLGGNDRIIGAGGDDVICAGPGNDRVFAGAGDDTVYGEDGIDKIRGGMGDDEIIGGKHRDFLKGGPDDDRIWGDDGSDRLRGGGGDDLILGGSDNDVLWGGPGVDRLIGGPGDDLMKGSSLDDRCDPRGGFDTLINCTDLTPSLLPVAAVGETGYLFVQAPNVRNFYFFLCDYTDGLVWVTGPAPATVSPMSAYVAGFGVGHITLPAVSGTYTLHGDCLGQSGTDASVEFEHVAGT